MKFNINNYVTVTLTALGAKVYNSRWDGLLIPINFTPLFVEEGYILRAQVWSLFQDFGPHTHLGMQNPFKGCIMEMDERDFEK